ncbi:hypothetical protein AKJ16_DCAP20259 [Drosera capensis]
MNRNTTGAKDEIFFQERYNLVRLRYIKESEEIRRAMVPFELIRRVRKIELQVNAELESDSQSGTKQAAALDLSKRLNNVRSFSDPASVKVRNRILQGLAWIHAALGGIHAALALEEWRKRKMERARQRELGRNATTGVQS